ncbi:MAG: hypothetical protein ABEI06_00770 [Halobacteriaceae archaeon]
MPEISDDEPDHAEQLAGTASIHKAAWKSTLEDMQELAEKRENNGWTTVAFPAGDTATEAPQSGNTQRFGLTYVVPSNYAETIEEYTETADFSSFNTYRAEEHGRVFLVTEFVAPDEEIAIYVAGNFLLRDAQGLIATAKKENSMYSHLETLDGTHITSFKHQEPEKFFPKFEEFDPEEMRANLDET